jgi:predicted nucleic acid-binding protein
MIVVDTNVLAYLFIEGDYSEKARELLKADSVWLAPFLWRSEFRNVLTLYVRKNILSKDDALKILNEAEGFMFGNEYVLNSFEIMELVAKSKCSAYDCEFVALAKRLGVDLYTSDKKVLSEFPQIASSLKSFSLHSSGR